MLFEAIAQLNQKFKPSKKNSKKKPATFKVNNLTTKKSVQISSQQKSHKANKPYNSYNKINTLLRRKELKKAATQK